MCWHRPTSASTRLLQAGIDAFVDLTAPGELPPYHPNLPLSTEYERRPIKDHGVPENFQQMNEIVDVIADAMRRRRAVYVHCRAGIGRTGTTIACLLAAGGLSAEAALEKLNLLWAQSARSFDYATVPETAQQADFVRDWVKFRRPGTAAAAVSVPNPAEISLPPYGHSQPRLQQRFTGAMLGLAVGEAVAAASHGLVRGEFAPLTDMSGGGPAKLPRGAWGDDTAMALCLADSLLSKAANSIRAIRSRAISAGRRRDTWPPPVSVSASNLTPPGRWARRAGAGRCSRARTIPSNWTRSRWAASRRCCCIFTPIRHWL